MSGGEQQMLTVARTLMGNPLLVLLDDPSEGVETVIVEQMATMALKVAHRAYVLETGRITLTGTGEALLHDPKVRAAYLGVAHGKA